MKRAKTNTFTMKLPLRCEPWQQDYLDKVFRVAGSLYNNLVSDRKKALFEMEKTRAWRSRQDELAQVYVSINGGTPSPEQKALLASLYQRRNEMLKAYGLNEYAFMSRLCKWRKGWIQSQSLGRGHL